MIAATNRRNRRADARSRRRAGATWVTRTPPTAHRRRSGDATLLVVLEGEVVGHVKGSEKRDYIVDPLGAVVAYLNSSQTLTDQFEYWPYGELVTEVETEVQPFLWVGSLGYIRENDLRTYIRAREYRQDLGSWMQLDPLWPLSPATSYAFARPLIFTDPSGGWIIVVVVVVGIAIWDAAAAKVSSDKGTEIQGIYQSRHPGCQSDFDKLKHCYSACLYEKGSISGIIGWYPNITEDLGIVSGGVWDPDDVVANQIGVKCAIDTWWSMNWPYHCEECCKSANIDGALDDGEYGIGWQVPARQRGRPFRKRFF